MILLPSIVGALRRIYLHGLVFGGVPTQSRCLQGFSYDIMGMVICTSSAGDGVSPSSALFGSLCGRSWLLEIPSDMS